RHTISKRDWSSDVCSSDLAVLRLTQPLTGEGTLWQNTVVTLLEMGAAFAIASLLGVSVGVLIGGNPRLTNFFTPVLLAAFAVPRSEVRRVGKDSSYELRRI